LTRSLSSGTLIPSSSLKKMGEKLAKAVDKLLKR